MPKASYLTIFLLFLLQFIYFPIGISHFETPKVYAAEFCIFLLLLIYLFTQKKIQARGIQKKSIICFSLLIVVTGIDLMFLKTSISFFGNSFRLQGIFLLWMLILFAFLSAKIPIKNHLHTWFLASVLFLQLIFTLVLQGQGTRLVGTIGEPNALAANIVFLWPFLYFQQGQKTGWKVVSILIACVVIFLSGSRSGIIALAIQLLFIVLTTRVNLPLKKILIICLFLLLCMYLLPTVDTTGPYENRMDVWQSALRAGFSHPIIGSGFGNMQFALSTSAKTFPNNLGLSFVDSSHNIFLDWLVQGGFIGISIFLYILYHTFLFFIQKKNVLDIVLLLGLITALSFNPASIVSLIALWWLIGQGSLNNTKSTEAI